MQAAREKLFAEMEKAQKERKKAEVVLDNTSQDDENYENVWEVFAAAMAAHNEATRKFEHFQLDHRKLLESAMNA